jgi:tetratricopeptide (TPR) repeat protein
MSDPLRTDGTRSHDAAAPQDRDAKIEQLLLLGLDHYFASRYELAINVWTRALFLDRMHPRARAYIDRARSALAERQRESEELLQRGVAAFHRGDGDEARRLLHAAIEGGAPAEEALAILERLNRLEPAPSTPAMPRADAHPRRLVPARSDRAARSARGTRAILAGGVVVIAIGGVAAWSAPAAWPALGALASSARGVGAPARPAAPVVRDTPLPLPRRGEETLARARALAASGRLRDALGLLEAVRPTDPQRGEADRLRADVQRQLLAVAEQRLP